MHEKNDCFTYTGSELAIFAKALNWKSYWSSLVTRFLDGNVLEVGAGIGSNTRTLHHYADCWTALEPDTKYSAIISNWIHTSNIQSVNVVNCTVLNLPNEQKYNAILYVDVLEHIEFDVQEVENAYQRLRHGGVIIIVSPAHNFLYSPFDKSIGHYRRYNKKTISRLRPRGCTVKLNCYLDSVGLLASLGNKVLLRSSAPTLNQVWFWDSVLIPISRIFDRFFGFKIGKTICVVWQKPF